LPVKVMFHPNILQSFSGSVSKYREKAFPDPLTLFFEVTTLYPLSNSPPGCKCLTGFLYLYACINGVHLPDFIELVNPQCPRNIHPDWFKGMYSLSSPSSV